MIDNYEQAKEIAYSIGNYLHDDCEKLEITGLVERKANIVNTIEFLYKPICYTCNLVAAGKKQKMRIYPIETKIKKTDWFALHLHDKWETRLYRYLIDERNNIHVILYPVMASGSWGIIKILTSSSVKFIEDIRKILKKKKFYIRNNQLFKNKDWISVPTEKAFFNIIGIDYVLPEDR